MNVTFDTNVFVSGFTRPEGRAGQALANILNDGDVLFVSQFIIDELKRVLTEKFGWTAEDLIEVNAWFSMHARMVTPSITLDILADEPDNRILECALAADADRIVIGDTRIVSLAHYLDSVDNSLTNG